MMIINLFMNYELSTFMNYENSSELINIHKL